MIVKVFLVSTHTPIDHQLIWSLHSTPCLSKYLYYLQKKMFILDNQPKENYSTGQSVKTDTLPSGNVESSS